MLAPWVPTFPVRPDPPLLEVFAIGAAVLVGVTLVHGSVLGRIVRDYHHGAKRLLNTQTIPSGHRCDLAARCFLCWSCISLT
jgi:hypothetical protein